MNPLSMFFFIFIIAFLVEAMVEYLFGYPFDKIEALNPYKWTLRYIACLIAFGLAWFYRLDLLMVIARYADIDWEWLQNPTIVGYIVTGFAIGSGSAFIHNLFGLVLEKKVFYQQGNDALESYNEPEVQD